MSSLDALVETDAAGNNPAEYIFFGRKRIARRDPDGAVLYYFADHLGSSRVVTNATGTVVDESDYYPFGGERIVVNNDSNPYKFTGKERDSETGLDYFGARYDSSSLGRFMSADPSIESVVLRNPQSWNRYTYTLNNPLRYIDPNGELWIAAENNTYTWVDKCGEKQTCYESVSAVQGNNLVIYGSTNAEDVTTIEADKGYIDLNEVAQHHDAFFTVKEGAESFLDLQTASDFYNTAAQYKQENPGSDKLVVTDAGKPDGAPFPPHKTHDLGRSVDLRYQDEKGRNLQGNTAADRADVDRTRSLIDAAKNTDSTRTTAHDQRSLEHAMHQDIRTTCTLGRSGHQTSSLVGSLVIVLVLWQTPFASAQRNAVSEYNVPQEVTRCMKSLGTAYEISGKINPFYLRGDFDGDGSSDYAVLIRKDSQQGVMICRRAAAKPTVLGAGAEFNQMKDLDFNAWQVHPKGRRVERGVGEGKAPTLIGDAILIEWEESASALIYWDGKRFIWYQQGD
jgi:RHS repeat-associated protein